MGVDLEATARRIEGLLDQLAGTDPRTAELAETLVAELVGLHTAGLERVLEVVRETDPALPVRLAEDEVVAGLLSLHDLHPTSLADRVTSGLDSVRPYLESHGGGVDLVDVSDDGVITLRLRGSCDGCAASQVTLETAVEEAVRRAAPEVVAIEVEEQAFPSDHQHDHGHDGGPALIPAEALWQRSTLPVEVVPT